MSLTRDAPASIAARAMAALYVSTEMGMFTRGTSPSMTGRTRSRSAAARGGAAPGRRDSPPTSSRSAPSAAIRTPASIARAGLKRTPPSENESGVTLMIPMTRVRAPRSKARPPGRAMVNRRLGCTEGTYQAESSKVELRPLHLFLCDRARWQRWNDPGSGALLGRLRVAHRRRCSCDGRGLVDLQTCPPTPPLLSIERFTCEQARSPDQQG